MATGLTFGVYLDSYAYSYAKTHNISYVLLDSVKAGDANGDGRININDVTAIQRHCSELEIINDELRLKAADVNRDGKITVDDATCVQCCLAEYDNVYNIGKNT